MPFRHGFLLDYEEEYQQAFRNVETKYKAEHERVRKWLEEQWGI